MHTYNLLLCIILSPAGTALDGADVTFENDFVSKMFTSVELYIGNVPIEIVNPSYIATEMIGLASYSTDEDRIAGASYSWIPDYGAGAYEITPSTVLQSSLWSFSNANITGSAANPSVFPPSLLGRLGEPTSTLLDCQGERHWE